MHATLDIVAANEKQQQQQLNSPAIAELRRLAAQGATIPLAAHKALLSNFEAAAHAALQEAAATRTRVLGEMRGTFMEKYAELAQEVQAKGKAAQRVGELEQALEQALAAKAQLKEMAKAAVKETIAAERQGGLMRGRAKAAEAEAAALRRGISAASLRRGITELAARLAASLRRGISAASLRRGITELAARLGGRVEASESEAAWLRKEADAQQAEISRIRSALRRAKSKAEAAQASVAEVTAFAERQLVAGHEAKLQALRALRVDMEGQMAAARAELEARLSNEQQRSVQVKARLSNEQQRSAQLEARLSNEQQRSAQVDAVNAELKRAFAALAEQSKQDLEVTSAMWRTQVSGLVHEVTLRDARIAELSAKIADRPTRDEDAHRQLMAATAEVASLRAELQLKDEVLEMYREEVVKLAREAAEPAQAKADARTNAPALPRAPRRDAATATASLQSS
ncbi:hypothetical protein JKP88DRAFT_350110 [Tribonema minus]|uniref:Uncharacterized protein n=1 Tax=Tribonema minus TaxID=303371 RepID=A0A835YPS3_9STRA|nr:hypothetical protein JKP88DRAFT_350110 [Tribonema minus]